MIERNDVAFQLLRGAIDCHVHSYPDVIRRKTTDLALVDQARGAGISGLVLKCHHGSTAERAWLLNQIQGDVQVFGGVVLNHAAGGINPHAVEAALAMGAKQIWMPTKSAANHQAFFGGTDGIRIVDEHRLRPVVIDVLKQVAATDSVLATGHLSPLESQVLIDEALAQGVRRISVTHPEWGVTAIPIAVQQRWAQSGCVYFERCLVSVQPDLPHSVSMDAILHQIRAVGVDTTIAATDYGMPQYDTPAVGLRSFIEHLLCGGFSVKDIRRMVQENPRRLLDFQTAVTLPPGEGRRNEQCSSGTA